MPANTQKLLSCGAVIIRETSSGTLFLMLRAFRHWDFPKGMNEDGESPKETALREICEETTIRDLEFLWGNVHIETGPYNRGKVARYYLAKTHTEEIELPVNEETGRPEHSEYRWVSLSEAKDLVSPRVARVLDWAAGILRLE